jgi:hypothetical protein
MRAGYMCNREFDRISRRSKVLSAQIHVSRKGSSRKRSMTTWEHRSRSSPRESNNDKDGLEY